MGLQPYYTPFKMIFQGIVTAELTFASTKACLRQKGGLGGSFHWLANASRLELR